MNNIERTDFMVNSLSKKGHDGSLCLPIVWFMIALPPFRPTKWKYLLVTIF